MLSPFGDTLSPMFSGVPTLPIGGDKAITPLGNTLASIGNGVPTFTGTTTASSGGYRWWLRNLRRVIRRRHGGH